jgi:tripartite ATP-independent transporter DctP family solute receptor
MTNSKHPITKPEDVKGLKMRTTGSPAHIEAFKELGANPVPMPIAELYTALEMKTVDAQEHPLGVFYSSKFYEVQKYVSLTYHAYSALVLVMSKAKYDALSPAHQQAVREAALEGARYQRQLNADNIAGIVKDLKSKGIQVVEKIDNGPFEAATKNVRTTFAAKFPGSADVMKAVDAQR